MQGHSAESGLFSIFPQKRKHHGVWDPTPLRNDLLNWNSVCGVGTWRGPSTLTHELTSHPVTESGEAVPGKRDRGVCTRKSPGTLQKSPPALGGYPGAFLLPFSFLNSLQVQRRRIIIAFYHRERLQGHQFFTRGSFVISNDPWRVVGLKRTHPNPMYSENKY